MHYLPILSTLVGISFVIAVFTRYLKIRHTHLLIWSIGLLFFGIGTLSEIVLGLTFSGFMLKFWYFSGAMMAAVWLGQGTIHLLVRKRGLALTLTVIIAALSVLGAVLVFTSPLTSAASTYLTAQPISSQYKYILVRSGLTLFLTILLNTYGTFALVGGAIYSVYIFFRKRVLVHRMIGSIFIAAGGILPAVAGSFVTLGLPDLLYLSELLGAILMYIGFIQATHPVPASQAVPAEARQPVR